MAKTNTPITIGSQTTVGFPKFGINDIPAKVDTGADASSIWASNIKEKQGELSFTLFGEGSQFYTGEVIKTRDYTIRSIKNSFGNSELRYKVKIRTMIEQFEININFSLSDRKDNHFPVLIGKRTLHGRFLVDVSRSKLQAAYKVLVLDVKNVNSVKNFLSKIEKSNKKLRITHTTFDDLRFDIANGKTTVKIVGSKQDVADFDFVFFKSVVDSRDAASALAHYLEKRDISFVDRPILYYPLTNKLAQYVIFNDSGISVPKSLFLNWRDTPRSYKEAVRSLGSPFIFKDIRESKGRNNHLVKSKTQFQQILSENSSAGFIAQQYIPNDGDYRILIFGRRIKMVINRSSNSKSTHLNNTSMGAQPTLVKEEILPGQVRKEALQAISIMKLDVGGVDMVQDKESGLWYCLEVQHGPQITSGSYVDTKREAFTEYLFKKLTGI